MENNKLVNFISGVGSIFSGKTPKHNLTHRQESILNDLSTSLTFEDTKVEVDEYGKKYYIENERLHLSVCVIGNSNVIQMVNTHDNIEKKFEGEFITKIIKLILKEKHNRLDASFSRMEERVDIMFDRIGSIIRSEAEKQELEKIV